MYENSINSKNVEGNSVTHTIQKDIKCSNQAQIKSYQLTIDSFAQSFQMLNFNYFPMKFLIGFTFFVLFLVSFSFAQQQLPSDYLQLKSLSQKEQIELSSLPELKMPASYKNKSIPYEIDNTTQACYSGLFHQAGLSCGQAASVGNGFTYEINRVRNLNGSLTENKYPTHFTWNWENGGNGWYGASYYHSMVVLKTVGNPNMATYGGTHDFGGAKRFMSGYDNYYEGMHNRISGAYAIKCSNEEGILTLKHWLNDHLDGSDVGGIGFFYSQHQDPGTTLPAGTPHAGEKVVTSWGASANHAMTITGYNDSVRWDYNGDGLYTNDIDLNDDDIIDVRDWEIGAFKMCNTYGTPYNGWMMYRTLALASNQGGIWNNTVNVLYAIEDYSPLLTYKVNLYYTHRGRIKIMAGMSTDLSATEPDYYLSFPILDYQGSDYGLQGEDDEISRQMEIGLDVTPFLNIIGTGTPAKFFFQIMENDDDEWGSGQIQNFSVINYSSGAPVEYSSTDVNVAIIQNGVTTVSVNHTPVFDVPEITTSVLPNAQVYHNYSHQMEAAGGDAPYRWEFDTDYQLSEYSSAIPLATTALSGSYISLPFAFNFYGETYNGFYLNSKGYIDFSGESYGLPYNNNALSNNSVSFMNRKCVAAFFSTTTCNTFYSAGADYYIIRWTGTNIDVSLKLTSDGEIFIYYNNCTPVPNQVWSSGISCGDLSRHILTPESGGIANISSVGYQFTQVTAPEIFNLSIDGLLTGVPTEEILAYPLHFKVTDAMGMIDRKTIPISTEGLIIDYAISTSNNNLIEWGENVNMNLTLRNATEGTINNLVLTLTCSDADVTMTDGNHNVALLNPLQELVVNPAFLFNLNYNFYNEQEITFHLTAQSNENTWEFDIVYPVYTADIEVVEYFVDDSDNNRLDIGETSDVYYTFVNEGGAAVEDVVITVSSTDPFLTINDNTDNAGDFIAEQSINAYFNFTADPGCLPGHVALLNFHIEGANGYEKNITGYLSIGQILETWETGTFETYNWSTGGDLPWVISNTGAYEGAYCLKSGTITHDQNSTFEIELQVISPGTISFYRRVSCEDDANNNWDYLVFYIDGIEKERWDGVVEWAQETYNVSAGVRNFKWVYHKDGSVNSNEDAAWVDFIEFPSIYDAEPLLTLSHAEVNKTLNPNQTGTETISISNLGGGIISYSIEILSDVPWLRNQRNITGSYMTSTGQSFNAGDTVAWNFTAKNTSPDQEYIKEITMVFPEGFMIDSLTDFYDQSEDTLLLVSGTPGNGGTFHWFGQQPDTWGMIHVNETATATVYARISEDFEGHLKVYYTLHGEVYGAEPHNVNDSLSFINYGPHINWVTTESTAGNLGIGSTDEITLNFNSDDLVPGVYTCNLNVFASVDTVIIPVSLTVIDPVIVNNSESFTLSVFPNPASDMVSVKSDYILGNISITNMFGQVLFKGNCDRNTLEIDLTGFQPGVYFISARTGEKSDNIKIVVQ